MRLIQDGPRNAKIVLVGEAPGQKEDETGKPFQGGSGWLLNQMLEKVGIRRWDCFVTNVCHIRPPNNEFSWFFKKANQIHYMQGVLQLQADLNEIQPNLVVGLGGQALKVLTGKSGITEWRGSILPCVISPGLKTVNTFHPALVLRTYDYRGVVEFDLKRAAEEMKSKDIFLPHREHHLDPPGDVREQLIQEMLQADWLSIDIETTRDWKLICVGFSDHPGRSLVIPVKSDGDLNDVRRLCESNVAKVFQNGMFDVSVLARFGIVCKNFAWDTMLGHHCIFTECASGQDELSVASGKKRSAVFQKGLAFQTSIYTREPYYKADGKLWQETGDKQMLYLYNGKDAAVTREIRDVQEKEIRDWGVMPVLRHEMSLVEPLLFAMHRGIRIDLDKRAEFEHDLDIQLTKAQAELNEAAGESVNVKSNKQIAALLFDKLKMKPLKVSEKTGKPSADKDVITALGGKSNHPVLRGIIKIREIRDLKERYVSTQIDNDGRMRCSFDITGTRTGRLSSRASIWGSGTNLQNQPRSIRSMFVPDPGYIFAELDFSQAEARIVAYRAACKNLIELFEDPTRDVHKENAARIFNIPVEKVGKVERTIAKKCVHALNYGMGYKRFVEVVNADADSSGIFLNGADISPGTGIRIGEAEAKAITAKYFALYPEIQENFWGGVQRDIKDSRTITNPFGRKRMFFGRVDDKFMNEAYSYYPQSTIGDLCCKALVAMWKEFQKRQELQAEVLLTVHDSIVIQCPVEQIHEVVDLAKRCMDIKFNVGKYPARIPTDCKVGFNWMERGKDGTNPRGLIDYSKYVEEEATRGKAT